jgi:hypothetical protein
VALPELGIDRIKAKIDTGARSSALHALDIRTLEAHGSPRVRFCVHPVQRDTRAVVECEAPLLGERWVRSSSGKSTLRPTILARICLGSQSWPIEITLVRRDVMGFRMLLGRQAIRRRFVVDPGRSFLMNARPQKMKKRERSPREIKR